MHSSTARWRVLLTAVAAFALLVAACGGGDDGASSGNVVPPTVESDIEFASLSGTLNGSGATFPQAFYEDTIAFLAEEAPDLTVNYGGGGSGKGKQDLADGVVDWAGTDSLVSEDDLSDYDDAGGILYFPTVAAPITVSYNLEGVDELRLDAASLAGIFMRKITKWNDPAIAATNAGVELPDEDIVVVRRSDGSGTTTNFTKYLAKAAPDVWTLGSGDTVDWHPDTQAGNGNAGVAQIIADTDGAIGYVDLADSEASGLQQALIGNRAGNFVAPTLEGASAAIAGATIAPDLTYDPLDAEGADAYPITAPTYIIVTVEHDEKIGPLVEAWLTYVLTAGQELAEDAGFARLPAELADRALAQLDRLVIG